MRRFLGLLGLGLFAASVTAPPAAASYDPSSACVGHPRHVSFDTFGGQFGSSYSFGNGITEVGGKLYRTTASESLDIIDFSSSVPSVLGSISGSYYYAPEIAGNVAAVMGLGPETFNVDRLSFIDISNPASPQFITALEMHNWCRDELCNETAGTSVSFDALTSDGDNFYVGYNANNSMGASWVGVMKIHATTDGITVLADMHTGISPDENSAGSFAVEGIDYSDGKVYLLHDWVSGPEDAVGEHRIAVYDANTMAMLGENSGVSGYVGSIDALVVDGTKAYVASYASGKIYVYDVSNPAAITKCGESSKVPGGLLGFLRLAACGSTHELFALDYASSGESKGVVGLSLANACSPNQNLSSFNTGDATDISGQFDLSADCSRMYMYWSDVITPSPFSAKQGIFAVNVTNPATPEVVNNFAHRWTTGDVFLRTLGTKADGSYSYAANRSSQKGMTIIDTRDSENPKWVKDFALGHQGVAAAMLSGDILAIAGGNAVSFWDTANAETPVKVKALIVDSGSIQGLFYFPEKMWLIACAQNKAVIYNVTDPRNPVAAATASAGSAQVFGADVEGNVLVLAADTSIVVFSVNGNTVTKVGTFLPQLPTGEAGDAIAVALNEAGTYAYAGQFDNRYLSVIHIEGDPSSWAQTAAIGTSPYGDHDYDSQIRNVYSENNILFVPYNDGILVFDIGADPTPESYYDALERIPAISFVRGVEVRDDELRLAADHKFEIVHLNECAIADFDYSVNGCTVTMMDKSSEGAANVFDFGGYEFGGGETDSFTFPGPGTYSLTTYAADWNGFASDAAVDFVDIATCTGGELHPAIAFSTPGGDVTAPATLRVSVTDFTLDCSTTNVSGHGHYEIWVDGVKKGTGCDVSFTLDCTMLGGNGAHTVKVMLTDNSGTPLSPEASASVSVNVSGCVIEPTCTYVPMQSVAGVSRASGSGGSFFRTSFWMTNPSSADLDVRLMYAVRTGQGMGGAMDHVDVTIPAHRTMAYDDVLTELFHATDNTTGVVIVETCSEDADEPIVTSRTYNDSSTGTFGQYIPAVDVMGGAGSSWLHGLASVSGSSRTNIGIVNLSSSPLNYTIALYDDMGMAITDATSTGVIAPWAINQLNAASIPGLGSNSLYSAKVTGDGAFFAYASKLDETTSDPIFIPAGLDAYSTQWIDGVASAAGSNNTYFKSNLLLANTSTSAATVSISFTKRNETTQTGDTKMVSLAAGQSMFYADAVAELFGLTGVAGQLKVTSAQPIVAWARTYNDATVNGGTGTYGQFIPAFGSDDLIDRSGATLQGLSEDNDFRANMGLVNTSASSVHVTVSAYGANGSALSNTPLELDIEGGQAIFIGNVLSARFGATNVSDAYIEVWPSVDDAIYAWASIVDNHSSDPTFVRPIHYMH